MGGGGKMREMLKYFVRLDSHKLNPFEEGLLAKNEVGGVVLYARNILNEPRVRELIESIKKINKSLLVAVDEEGGSVSRLNHLFPSTSQPYLATLSGGQIRDHYSRRSIFLKGLGFDVNLAPVVDIASDEFSALYKRSYGPNPEIVSRTARICIEEQKKTELLSCVKHFPGLGGSRVDSHSETPEFDLGLVDWEKIEGKVFRECVEAGVELVMLGHGVYPKIDGQIASLSPFWINEVLRSKLGFEGKIITDDLDMRGFPQEKVDSAKEIYRNLKVDYVIYTTYGRDEEDQA